MIEDDPSQPGAGDPLDSADLFAPAGPGSAGGSGRHPETIGPYRIESVLGAGGFGVVYLAEQRHPVRRRVALKLIKPGMDSHAVVGRFEAERQALALMDHPNVARVLGAGTTERGLPYFVMEHVRGVPITEHCDARRLTIEARVRLLMTVCDAVQHAHHKGVIHRDLKPSNILVEDSGAPKIIDFGVAKALGPPLTDATAFTHEGQLLGTPEYMSPEQAGVGTGDVDTRTDIYALGVILYELLTGTRPLNSPTLRSGALPEIHRIIREVEPPKPSTRISQLAHESGADRGASLSTISGDRSTTPGALRRTLSHELDWIAMRCLEKDRERRYDAASALADDLGRFLADEPVLAGPPSAAYRARTFARRNRVAVAAGGAIGIAIMLGLGVATYGLIQATRERDAARLSQADAESARAEAEAIIEFLTTMLASVEPGAEPADVTVRHVLDDAASRIDAHQLADQPIVEARLRYTIGRAYLELGLYEQSGPHLDRSLEILRDERSDDDPLTIRSANDVARLRQFRGELDAAAAIFEANIPRARRVLGDSDPLTLIMLNNLAALRFRQGEYALAAEAFSQTLEVLEATVGPDDRRTLICRTNLAVVYQTLDRYDDAEREYEAIVAARERTLGADHADTVHARLLLGTLYAQIGRMDDAEPQLREVIRRRRETLGPDHPATADALDFLAQVLHGQERFGDAEPLQREAHEIRHARLGPDHPDTLKSLYGLAGSILEGGRPSEALPLIEDCVARARQAIPSHWLLAEYTRIQARCLIALERDAEAEPLLLEAYPVLARTPGRERYTRAAARALARLYERRGDAEAMAMWDARADPGAAAQPEEPAIN